MSDSENQLLKSPYGQVTFESMRRRNLALVDKSRMIETLESDVMTVYPVLLRPRRFGKSTFVQMLKCFYDISYKDQYDELFAGTDIYLKNLPSHNTYHVLVLDFSRVDPHNSSVMYSSFFSAVSFGIKDFKRRYPDFAFAYDEIDRSDAVTLLNNFVAAYGSYSASGRLYLMIDEYDNFANNILSQDLSLFKTITGNGGLVKAFYAAVKAAAADPGYIAKTFITGVSSVSLDSLTSGFNISLNVTTDKHLNEYAGFTETELQKIVPQLVDLPRIGMTADEVISRMKPVYDGFCFSRFAENPVYNSSMCLFYLIELQKAGEFLPPEKYTDPASDQDGLKLRQLFDLAEDGLAESVTDTYLSGDPFFLEKLSQNINLNKTDRYDEVQFLSMLFYMGYLTIDPRRSSSDGLFLKVPNIFMAKLFAQCTVDLRLKPSSQFMDYSIDVSSLLETADDLSGFASSCTEFLCSIFTSQVLTHMSEMALNLVLHAKLSTVRGIYAEIQKSIRVPGEGECYADLVITVNKGKSSECIYLVELKYAAKSRATSAFIEELKNEAVRQLTGYRTALEFRDRQIRSYAMVFAGSVCVYCGQCC